MKTVLVTGAAGFLGANLIQKLLNEQVSIHVLLRPESDLWRIQPHIQKLKSHEIDLEDYEALSELIIQIQPDVIFHLAADGVIPNSKDNRKVLMSNIVGTFNLLQATQDIDYESFIHVGGSTEYGKKIKPLSEGDGLEPSTFYGATKACGTKLALQFASEYEKPLTVMRPFAIYGPLESPRRLIPTAIEAAMTGGTLGLTRPGFARDYIFVEDVVDACILAWKNRAPREAFNIASGVQTTNEQVVQLIEKMIEKKIATQIGAYPPRLSDSPHWVADITKAKQILGWHPKHTLKEGIQKTLQYALTLR